MQVRAATELLVWRWRGYRYSRVHPEQREGLGLKRRGPGGEDDLRLGVELGVGDVVGERAEVLQQGPEAMQREPVIGGLARVLGLGAW